MTAQKDRPPLKHLVFDGERFGNDLRKFRHEMKYSVRDVDSATGVNYNQVSRIELNSPKKGAGMDIIRLAFWANLVLSDYVFEKDGREVQLKLTLRPPSGRVVAGTLE